VFVNMHESILGTEVSEYDVHPHDPGYRKMARYWFVTLTSWLQASGVPTVSISSPQADVAVSRGSTVRAVATPYDNDGIRRVDFRSCVPGGGGQVIHEADETIPVTAKESAESSPWEAEFELEEPGAYTVYARVWDNDSLFAYSNHLTIDVSLPGGEPPSGSVPLHMQNGAAESPGS
jgi:hypothetical protein